MLNRTSLPRPVTPHALAPEEEGVRLIPLGGLGWQRLVNLVQLPTTLQGYFVFLLCLLILAFTMALHVTLSAEIMRLNEQLYSLEDEFAAIERTNANIVWRVSGYGALADVAHKAGELGYVPITQIAYVEKQGTLPATAPGATESAPLMEEFQGGPAFTTEMSPAIAPESAPAGTLMAGEPNVLRLPDPLAGEGAQRGMAAAAQMPVPVAASAQAAPDTGLRNPFNNERLQTLWSDARAWMRARFEEPVFGGSTP